MRFRIGLIGISILAHAQSPADAAIDPVDLLMRVRDQVTEHGRRIPNHTCVETVERDRFEPVDGRFVKSCDTLLARRRLAHYAGRLRLDATDRLRLDVTVAGDRELYSWAGAAHFEEGEIDRLIPDGAMGTGAFANLLLSVFDSPVPRLMFTGQTVRDVTRLLEYSFSIPVELSQYRAKGGNQWLPTGYTGTLLADPQTARLSGFTVRTEELPAATGLCEVDTSLDYGTVPFGGIDYLMPVATRQRFIGRDGSEGENRVAFSSCREFRGKSEVEFGALPPPASNAAGPAPAAVHLPAGLPVTVTVAAAIDSAQAAAGDRIEGRLARPILDSHHNTLVPEGALMEGRLMRVELLYAKPPETVIALRWETLAVNGVKSPVSLKPDHRMGILKSAGLAALRAKGWVIELPRIDEEQYGVYRFPGKWAVVQNGYRTEWLTQEP